MPTSKEVTDFATRWVSDNIEVGPYDPGAQIIDQRVQDLIEAAEREGISEEDLEENLGDLSDYIGGAFEDATDNEVERLASKDD
jgi:hypothetical protein